MKKVADLMLEIKAGQLWHIRSPVLFFVVIIEVPTDNSELITILESEIGSIISDYPSRLFKVSFPKTSSVYKMLSDTPNLG